MLLHRMYYGSLAKKRKVMTRRPGFTLVELLVVIAIIGMLVGLLLPAINAAREAGRRAQCMNNQKQIGLALLNHLGEKGVFPAGCMASLTAGGPQLFDTWTEASSFAAGAKMHGQSWMLEILPYLDYDDLYKQWDLRRSVVGNGKVSFTDIKTFYCPSRRAGLRPGDATWMVSKTATGGGTDYGGCLGRVNGWKNDVVGYNHRFEDLTRNDSQPPISDVALLRGIFRPNYQTKMADITDGASHTIMIGELQRLQPVPGDSTGDTTTFEGWALGNCSSLFATATDPGHSNPGGMNNGFFESPGSQHPVGAYFGMADGSVQFISENVDSSTNDGVFPLLGSMADGAMVQLPND